MFEPYIVIAILMFFICLIVGGFIYLMAWDEEEAETGKLFIKNAFLAPLWPIVAVIYISKLIYWAFDIEDWKTPR